MSVTAIRKEFSAEQLEHEVIAEEMRRIPADPEPLRRAAPPSKPYPVDALGSILSNAAQALHKVVKAPLALCGQSVLAAASLAAQSHGDVHIDGRSFPITLWMLTIAESGERKSAVDSIALAAHKKHERERIEIAERLEPEYRLKLAAYEAAVKQAKGKKTLHDITMAIESCGKPPEEPPRGILLTPEPTIEAIQKIYLSGVASLGLFSDEGGVFFGGHSMSKDHALRSIGALSKLWDEGVSDRIRATDGQRKIYGRRLAMHMLVQPVIAEKILSDPLLSGQGFLARCLMAWPETTAGSRTYVEASPWGEPGIRWFADKMIGLLRLEPKQRNRGELEPRQMNLSPQAKETWIEAYENIEKLTAPRGEFAQVRPWASKAAEQILRIAGVLTIVDDRSQIESPEVLAAAKLMAWHMGEVVRLVGATTISPQVKHAEAVLEWLREKGIELIDSKTLLNRGPNCVRVKEALNAAMAVLVEHGWAEVKRDVVMGKTKVRRAWQVRIGQSQESQRVATESQRRAEA